MHTFEYTWQIASIFIRDKPVLSSEKMLHKDYDRMGSVEKISGRVPQGAWRHDERNGGKPPVAKNPDSDSDSGLRPQMGAWHQDRLVDWPSVVT
jgi:hypothetical protein